MFIRTSRKRLSIVCLTQAWLTVFSVFFLQKVHICRPNLASLLGALSRACINLFCLNSVKCSFCPLGANSENTCEIAHIKTFVLLPIVRMQIRTFCKKKEVKTVRQIILSTFIHAFLIILLCHEDIAEYLKPWISPRCLL